MIGDLQRWHPESEVLFLQGAAGNINPPVVSAGAAKAEQHGRLLAEEVQRLLGQLQPVRGRELSFVRRDMKLPARTATGEPVVLRVLPQLLAYVRQQGWHCVTLDEAIAPTRASIRQTA